MEDRQTDIVVSIYRERYKGMELPELKSTLSAITNSPDGFNSRLEIAEEKISYTAIETIQTEPQSSSEWMGNKTKLTSGIKKIKQTNKQTRNRPWVTYFSSLNCKVGIITVLSHKEDVLIKCFNICKLAEQCLILNKHLIHTSYCGCCNGDLLDRL